jgi:hypothetical protein
MPVADRTRATSGDGAARRRDPPSSRARCPLLTRTARPLASACSTARQVDDQLAGGAEQAAELLAQDGSGRDAEVSGERGDGVAAAVCRGGEPEAGFMSRGVRHGASGHVSGGRPRGAVPALMAADRLHAGRDYAWRGARRIILRSGDIAVRNTPAGGRCVRVCAFVTSDGIGGTDGLAGPALWPGAVIRDLDAYATDGLADGAGGTATSAGMPGPDPGGVRLVRAWCLPLVRWVRRSILGDRWLAAGRNAATENGWVAAASRRPAGPASAAGSRGPGRLLSRWPYGRNRGVHAS